MPDKNVEKMAKILRDQLDLKRELSNGRDTMPLRFINAAKAVLEAFDNYYLVMKMNKQELEKDLDIALDKLWEALQVGKFIPSDYVNINNKLKTLKARRTQDSFTSEEKLKETLTYYAENSHLTGRMAKCGGNIAKPLSGEKARRALRELI